MKARELKKYLTYVPFPPYKWKKYWVIVIAGFYLISFIALGFIYKKKKKAVFYLAFLNLILLILFFLFHKGAPLPPIRL